MARPSYRYDTALCQLDQPVSRLVLAEKPIQRRIYATGVFINQTIHHYWNNRKSERGMVLG